jgi:hypothetical protein
MVLPSPYTLTDLVNAYQPPDLRLCPYILVPPGHEVSLSSNDAAEGEWEWYPGRRKP